MASALMNATGSHDATPTKLRVVSMTGQVFGGSLFNRCCSTDKVTSGKHNWSSLFSIYKQFT